MRTIWIDIRVRPGLRRLAALAVAIAAGLLAAVAMAAGSAAAPSGTLAAAQTLGPGQQLQSPDGHYTLVMQTDGNLVEYAAGGVPIWASGTRGAKGAHAVLQANGNLVIFNSGGGVVWSSDSRSGGCPRLLVQDDGNVVIYGPLHADWASNSVQNELAGGQRLDSAWSLYSKPEDYRLTMKPDGNLVLYDGAGKALWDTHTYGHPGAHAAMHTDGNLVVVSTAGKELWTSRTYGNRGAHLLVLGDGNAVVYSAAGKALWSSGTNGKGTGGSVSPPVPPAVSCPAPTPPPTTTTAPAPLPPVMTSPVTTPVPSPSPAPRALRVRLRISWTWDDAVTRLRQTKIGTFPGRTELTVSCHGRGCPRSRYDAKGGRALHRALHSLEGHRYRAGDQLRITLRAPGYRPERAVVRFRWGRLPAVSLLRS